MFSVNKVKNGTYSLSGPLTIHQIEDLKKVLEQFLKEKNLVLILGEVTEIDTAAIQLLASFKKTYEKTNDRLSVQTNEFVQDALNILGFRTLTETFEKGS